MKRVAYKEMKRAKPSSYFINILFIKNKYQLFIIFGSGQIFTTSIFYLYDVLFSKVTSPLLLFTPTSHDFCCTYRRRRGSPQNFSCECSSSWLPYMMGLEQLDTPSIPNLKQEIFFHYFYQLVYCKISKMYRFETS